MKLDDPLAVDGANRTDMKLVEPMLKAQPLVRPKPTAKRRQHLSTDKGYDYDDVRPWVRAYGYTAHIRVKGEGPADFRPPPGYRARRWTVERTHSWLNRCRRLLIRWEKKVANYLTLLHFAFAWICCHGAEVFG